MKATLTHRCAVAAALLAVVLAPAAASAAPRELALGSRGQPVRALQQALVRLTYLPPGAADGVFGTRTWHAVVAFQGWSGLTRDGVVGSGTAAALRHARPPQPSSRARGIEVHIRQQVLLLVADGRVRRAIHVSTGAAGRTPLGRYTIIRRESMSWSASFGVWLPFAQYFVGGYAMHEYPDVPAFPASHGCVRLPAAEAPSVWAFGRLGMRVWTIAG